MREAGWKWIFLMLGLPLPGGAWHEVPGRTMMVEALGDELLDPVVDGERFFGLERIEVHSGPRITALSIPD